MQRALTQCGNPFSFTQQVGVHPSTEGGGRERERKRKRERERETRIHTPGEPVSQAVSTSDTHVEENEGFFFYHISIKKIKIWLLQGQH